MAAEAVKGRTAVQHYYAIAERGRDGGWFMTFPGGAGYSFAETAEQIVEQAQDWLATAAMGGGDLPRSIENGAKPPSDLSGFESPVMVVVIPFEAEAEAREAA
jgi:predicted RNase H-like HicB family nuclease